MLKPSFLLLCCLFIGVAFSADKLWEGCSGQYCADISADSACGLTVTVKYSGFELFSRAFDLSVPNPSVCVGTYCIKLSNLTIQSDGQIHPCVYLSTSSSGPDTFLGCISSDNNLAECLFQGCPSGCSGHGECMSTGVCDCDRGWYGAACDDLEPIFDQCAQVPNYGTLCLRLDYEECAIKATVYGSPQGLPINITLYNTTVAAPQFNTYFGTPICFDSIPTCTGCLYFDSFTLNDTYAKGCPTVNLSCPVLGTDSYSYGCFEDTTLVPDCFGNCPLNCSGNGDCVNGACQCHDGWKEAACNIADCSNEEDCYGNGVCIRPHTCQCIDGYFGDWCAGAKCDAVDQCNYHGLCRVPNVCTCDAGYNGTTCSEVVCATPCQNGGKCDKGKCECSAEWEGSDCTTKKKEASNNIYVVVGVVVGIIVAAAAGVAGFLIYKRKSSQGSTYNVLDTESQ